MGRKYSEAIKLFLGGELHYADLSTAEETYLKQLQSVEALWSEGKPDSYVRNALFEQYHISDNTARKIMRECMTVFGDMKAINKDMMRYRTTQMILRAYEMAEAEGNYKAMIAASKALIDANGLNNEDPDLPDFAKLEAAPTIIALPEGMEGMIQQMLAASGGVLDHTELPDLPAEPVTVDITYEEDEPEP